MPIFTFVARVSDSLILAESMDSGNADVQEMRTNAKGLIKSMGPQSPQRLFIDMQPAPYHIFYIVEEGVIFLTLAERSYPRKLAFSFLQDLYKSFSNTYPSQKVARFARPYACVEFDQVIQRKKKEYMDPQSQRNIRKLNEDLSEISQIMRKNIDEVLQRGEKLENVQSISSHIVDESKKFAKYGRWLNIQAMWKTWAPIVFLVLILLFALYWKFFV